MGLPVHLDEPDDAFSETEISNVSEGIPLKVLVGRANMSSACEILKIDSSVSCSSTE